MPAPFTHPFDKFAITIGEVVVETLDEVKDEDKRIPEVLKNAFKQLAERLKLSPQRRYANISDIAINKIELNLSTDVLLSPAGADRLADELWAQLIRGI
jgi:hypothetical protein